MTGPERNTARLTRLDAYWYAPLPAERLGLVRALVGGFALIYLVARFNVLADFSRFAPHELEPVGVVRLLDAPLPATVTWSLWALTVAVGAAFSLGAWFRISGPAFAGLLLWVLCYRNSWGMIFHLENLMWLHVLVLGLSRAADAFSWDRRVGRSTSQADTGRYGWPIRLMCAVTVATYLIAGIAKLRITGWHWVEGDMLRAHIAYDALRKLQLGSIYSPIGAALVSERWLFAPLALFSMLVELGAPLAMLHRKLGWIWVLCAWGFHVGVALLMAITFVYPLFGVAYASFFPVERILERVPRFVQRRTVGLR